MGVTSRDCHGIPGAQDCLGDTNPNIRIVQQGIDGGRGLAAHQSLAPVNGGFAEAAVTYGDLDLPVIRAQAIAGLDNRNNTNSYGYQSFVFTGPDSLFALTATLDFTSSASPVAASIPQGNEIPEIAGEGSAFVRIGLMDTSAVAGLVSAMDILNYGFTSGCGTAGIYGVASYDFATAAGGAGGGSLTLDRGCDGAAFTLTSGTEFVVFIFEQTPTNRGGFVDASHTLRLGLADSLTADQQATLIGGLVSARSAAPEPASWALTILGFGGVGAVLRSARRKRAAVVA